MEFFPNKCVICPSTTNLLQCSRCQMVSYCGEEHRKSDITQHQEICKIISDQLKSMKVSHIYEKLRGVDQEKWNTERRKTLVLIKSKLSRNLLSHDVDMVYFPRTCFVCYEATQRKLFNCPNCPGLSFCSRHKDLRSHSKICGPLNLCSLAMATRRPECARIVQRTIDRIFFTDSKAQNPPKSIKQLLMHYPKPPEKLEEIPLILMTDILSASMTMYNALCKVKMSSNPKIIVHSNKHENHITMKAFFKLWEFILHLIPELKFLKIVFVDPGSEEVTETGMLCDNCKLHNKQVELKTVKIPYAEYMKTEGYETPDVFMYYSITYTNCAYSAVFNTHKISLPSGVNKLHCPVILASYDEIGTPQADKKISSSKYILHYSGSNEFSTLKPRRDFESQGIYMMNANLLIFQIASPAQENGTTEIEKTVQNEIEMNGIQKTNNDEKTIEKNDFDNNSQVDDNKQNKADKITNALDEKIKETDSEKSNTKQLNLKETEKNNIGQNKVETSEIGENKIEEVHVKQNEVTENKAEKCENVAKEIAGVKLNLTNEIKKNSQIDNDSGELIVPNWDFYKIDSCQVCHATHRCVPCSRCKMISYCKEEHRKEHWPEHKDLCKVILGMLKEIGGTTLFDKSETSDMDSWLRSKIDLLLKVQTKLGRKLVEYEKQMILFPRTCFVCHESDYSVLKACGCGICLCKQHKKNPKHQSMCRDFQQASALAKVMQIIRKHPHPKLYVEDVTKAFIKTIPCQKKVKKLPNSISAFIDSNIKLSQECIGAIGGYRKYFTSEFFSRPLTALYAIEKLNLISDNFLNIHIIGGSLEEYAFVDYWEILFHWLPDLKEMKITFIGPELEKAFLTKIMICGSCKDMGKKIPIVCKDPVRYDEYLEGKSSSKPDIIFGFNLDLHESEYGISECAWKESIMALKKQKAPFVMTAGSGKRAEKDHQKLCSLLEKSVSHDFCQENPFASLILERDFETEEFQYSNKYILIYQKLCENVKEETEMKVLEKDLKTKEVLADEIKEKFEPKSQIQNEEKKEIYLTVPEKMYELPKISDCETRTDQRTDIQVVKSSHIEKSEELQKEVNTDDIEKLKKEQEGLESVQKEAKCLESTDEETKTSIKPNPVKIKSEETPQKIKSKESTEKIKNTELKTVSNLIESATKSSDLESSNAVNGVLINEDSILTKEDKVLKENELLKGENALLKKENEKLINENIILKNDIERLRSENNLIKDIRNQIKESILSALNERK